ncbi:hypothetical protein JOC37_002425 [Desulfohalotomaculum tongense]|uniref:PDGLE domain-containing protein n=1 Tax=Desulforadius tongensis TaxID=1216062 RepID=UPI00195A4840|nr:PDGLE domain-containing protein [Desulforadius tongensis]MBM7856002.1 hypothetical protein [Desulforadius tongensis]
MFKSKNQLISLALILLIAGFLSNFASSHPDGLERVAEDLGFISQAAGHTSVLEDYSLPGIPHSGLAGGLAGILGCTLVFALVFSLSTVIKRLK